MQSKNSIDRVRGQVNDRTRRPRSEGGAAEDHEDHRAEKRVHPDKANKMTMQVVNNVEVKRHKIVTLKVKRKKPDSGKDQTVRQTHREPAEAAH